MKEIEVEKIKQSVDVVSLKKLADTLDELKKYSLEFSPWEEFAYQPRVSFTIGYTEKEILIKFFVEEKEIRATNSQVYGPVWEDSCVEFFVSFSQSKSYYNLEFNCLGTCYAAYGSAREGRELLPLYAVNTLRTYSTIKKTDDDNICWELTVLIPIDVFIYSAITDLQGVDCRANFYKCGDLLIEPHFIAWSNIESTSPNFHLPDFFGTLHFA
jgi:hypothetical protein